MSGEEPRGAKPKLTWAQAVEIRRLRQVNRFMTAKELAARYGVTRPTIQRLLNGQSYQTPRLSREEWAPTTTALRARERRAQWRSMQLQRNRTAQAARS